MNKKIFSTLELINLKAIKEKIIILQGNKFAKILKVEPVNLSLKSNKEKELIYESYEEFLKVFKNNFQIIIKNKEINLTKYIEKIESIKFFSNNELKNSYIDHIRNLINSEYVYEKVFYLIYSINTEDNVTFNKVINIIAEIDEIIKVNFEKMGNKIIQIEDSQYMDVINYILKK
ncbi:MAG: hypothetical protein PHH22_01370 [Clostridia bacterium]|nr:hypothetical protein [Clostridia bacterium]